MKTRQIEGNFLKAQALVYDNMCSKCLREIPEAKHGSVGVGYALTERNEKVCYSCCAIDDRAWMREKGKITLYLSHSDSFIGKWTDGEIANWPGTLKLPCRVKLGRHNIAGNRYDAWFTFEGQQWHGVQYGNNTQLIHCKRMKS